MLRDGPDCERLKLNHLKQGGLNATSSNKRTMMLLKSKSIRGEQLNSAGHRNSSTFVGLVFSYHAMAPN